MIDGYECVPFRQLPSDRVQSYRWNLNEIYGFDNFISVSCKLSYTFLNLRKCCTSSENIAFRNFILYENDSRDCEVRSVGPYQAFLSPSLCEFYLTSQPIDGLTLFWCFVGTLVFDWHFSYMATMKIKLRDNVTRSNRFFAEKLPMTSCFSTRLVALITLGRNCRVYTSRSSVVYAR